MHVRMTAYYTGMSKVIWISIRTLTFHSTKQEMIRQKFENDQQLKYYGIYQLHQSFSVYSQTPKMLNYYGGMLIAEKPIILKSSLIE
jgi:hypothetical protein